MGVGDGSGVSVGGEVGVGCNVAVRTPALAPGTSVNGVAGVVRVEVAVAVQPLIVNTMMIDKMRFDLTY